MLLPLSIYVYLMSLLTTCIHFKLGSKVPSRKLFVLAKTFRITFSARALCTDRVRDDDPHHRYFFKPTPKFQLPTGLTTSLLAIMSIIFKNMLHFLFRCGGVSRIKHASRLLSPLAMPSGDASYFLTYRNLCVGEIISLQRISNNDSAFILTLIPCLINT